MPETKDELGYRDELRTMRPDKCNIRKFGTTAARQPLALWRSSQLMSFRLN